MTSGKNTWEFDKKKMSIELKSNILGGLLFHFINYAMTFVPLNDASHYNMASVNLQI